MRISDWSSDVCSSDLIDNSGIETGEPEWHRDTRRCPDGSVNRRCHEAAWGKKHFEPAWENKALRLLPVSEPALDPWLWLARRQSDRLDLAELARAHDEVAQLVDALGHDGCTAPHRHLRDCPEENRRWMLRATQSVIGDLQQAARIVGREQAPDDRSEEHTSELQSLMRISYAVF